jgi:hypothetical protein
MASVKVDGLLMAKQGDQFAVTFEMDGHPILIRPSYGAKRGTIVRKGSKVAKAHPELFEPLTVEAEFDHLDDG